MRKKSVGALAALTVGLCLTLSGCGEIDETILDTQANLSVNINVPYATATPLPEHLNVPDPIVIDSEGNVTLNDASYIEGDFQSAKEQEDQTEYSNLSLGNTGIAVQALQARLQELGYFNGEVTGLFDSETEEAVKRFEQTYGTMQTGVATTKFQLKLFASNAPIYGSDEYNDAVVAQYTILQPGAVGSSVYALQQRLKNLGYPISDLTGVYDEQTAQSIRLFYQAYGLAPSDVANVSLQKELYADTALAYGETASQETTDGETEPSENSDGTLSPGASGEGVSLVQRRLIELGYLGSDGETGVYDDGTEAAINRFLQTLGYAQDGILTAEMQTRLFADSAPEFGDKSSVDYEDLNVGDSGEAVMNLQRRLVELGYASGTPNGKYRANTIKAVEFYQQCNGMEVNGQKASAAFQAQLFSDDALTYQETQAQDFSDIDDTSTQTPASVESEDDESIREENDALYFSLKAGSSGNAVITLQERLVELGYLDEASGVYDEDTQLAVKRFQNAICVPATGEASASFQRYIYSKAAPEPSIQFYSETPDLTALRQGDSGDEVTRLQRRLWELGFLKKENIADSVGTYNEATSLAVAEAQLKMGYQSTDGNAGVEFQSFLFSKYGDYLKN